MDNKDFEDFIKKRLENFVDEPDEDAWKQISSKLHKRNKIVLIARWSSGIAAAILMIFLVNYFYSDYQTDEGNLTVKNNTPIIEEQSFSQNKTDLETSSKQKYYPFNKTDRVQEKPEINNEKDRKNAIEKSVTLKPVTESIATQKLTGAPGSYSGQGEGKYSGNRPIEDDSNRLLERVKRSQNVKKGTGIPLTYVARLERKPFFIWPYHENLPIIMYENELIASERAPVVKDSSGPSRFKIYIKGMPTFGYNQIQTNKEDDFLITKIYDKPFLAKDRLGLRAELGGEYVLSKRSNIFIGVLFFKQSQKIKYSQSQVSGQKTKTSEVDQNTFTIIPEYGEKEIAFTHDLKHLGITVGFDYLMSGYGQFKQYVGISSEIHRSMGLQVKDEIFSSSIYQPSDFYYYINLFYRLERNLNDRFKFIAQPTFNFGSFIDKQNTSPFYIKPYGFGINVGISYTLNN